MGLDNSIKLKQKFEKGANNLITDVKGVKVGNVTLKDEEKGINTGVTAVLPHEGNLFKSKVMAGSSVINGFTKCAGVLQIEELGSIETPIILTNTFGVGTALNAVIKYMMKDNPDIGTTTGTVNAVVTECNDGILNDIRGLHVKEEDVVCAIEQANILFEEGAVGAGTGMSAFGIKGGIGSSSRIVRLDDESFVVGTLVLSNFGTAGNMIVHGHNLEYVGRSKNEQKDKGSIVIIIATDIPMSERQLKRLSNRAAAGLGRVGSFIGNGSGDVAISFCTSNIIQHYEEKEIFEIKMVNNESFDKIFEATVESIEESIISSIYHGKTTFSQLKGKDILSFKEAINIK